ncbi:MAG: dual specificity protein phosphatase family protein [Anaerolineales bacterium]|nr:dual specificity protein phosphatase family protein [Anaerolineales bacterium]
MTGSPDISQITPQLFISAWPRGQQAEELGTLGIRLILSMHWVLPKRSLGRAPLRLLWLPTIDLPFTPMPMSMLRRGAQAALPVLAAGGGVLCHCRAGVHRSVAMACCVLIAQGYTAEEAMRLVKEKRPVADPYIWYIERRIRKFAAEWNHRPPR